MMLARCRFRLLAVGVQFGRTPSFTPFCFFTSHRLREGMTYSELFAPNPVRTWDILPCWGMVIRSLIGMYILYPLLSPYFVTEDWCSKDFSTLFRWLFLAHQILLPELCLVNPMCSVPQAAPLHRRHENTEVFVALLSGRNCRCAWAL